MGLDYRFLGSAGKTVLVGVPGEALSITGTPGNREIQSFRISVLYS